MLVLNHISETLWMLDGLPWTWRAKHQRGAILPQLAEADSGVHSFLGDPSQVLQRAQEILMFRSTYALEIHYGSFKGFEILAGSAVLCPACP